MSQKVKNNKKNVLEANCYFCRSCREKTGREGFFVSLPQILNRGKVVQMGQMGQIFSLRFDYHLFTSTEALSKGFLQRVNLYN